MRESNPFLDLSPDKAHLVFNKLFKHADENKRHSKPVIVTKNADKLIKSKSERKIEHKMKKFDKNLDKVIEIVGSSKKSSKKAVKALNNTDINNHEENKKESSFTLKNKNLARMNELVFGTKRRQSNTDNNIMKILNQSVSIYFRFQIAFKCIKQQK